MLDKEFKFYLDNQEKLVKVFNDKYLVIIGEEIVGAYNSKEEALYESLKKHERGTFLIQKCTPGKAEYTQTFTSRVSFV